jgi:hypothetical protein
MNFIASNADRRLFISQSDMMCLTHGLDKILANNSAPGYIFIRCLLAM